LLHTRHMIDEDGQPRPELTTTRGSRQFAIRHISSNHLESTRVAVRLVMALEDSLQSKQFPTMVDTYLRHKYGNTLSSDLHTIQENLSSHSDFDKLLHYINWNPRALSIVSTIFDPPEYDIPADLHEYSWEEVDSTLINTNDLRILVCENNSSTIVYLTQQQTTRRASRNDSTKQKRTTDTQVEHNLASVKNFHRIQSFKLSTFHLDTAKTLTATDHAYLHSIHSSINHIRQNYEDPKFRVRKVPNLAKLQQTLTDITQIRSQMDRTLLSRQRYVQIRRYIGTIRMRIQRIIERTQDHAKDHQTKITEYFSHPQKVLGTTQDSATSSDHDNDQFEDYRGESD